MHSVRHLSRRAVPGLPDDYKAFIDLYGTGQVFGDGWAVVGNVRDTALFGSPLSESLNGLNSVPEYYRRVVKASGWPCPHPICPDPGGLLPFGSVVEVHNLNWLTTGRPNRWDVVYYFGDGLEFTRLEGDSFTVITSPVTFWLLTKASTTTARLRS